MTRHRRITAVVDQQHRLRELGRIRFGERKAPNRPGRPLELPRITGTDQAVIEAVAREYGGDVVPWEREEGQPPEYEVTITNPKGIAIAVPPALEAYSAAYEQWAKGFLTVRCDGEVCQYRSKTNGRKTERACVCAEREAADPDYLRECSRTTRINVGILGVPILGLFRVDTKSYNASSEVPATLAFLKMTHRAAWMRMVYRTDRGWIRDKRTGVEKPTVRRFPVIVVEAPFMIDEVTQIERGADMAQISAPRAPALAPRARPQLGAGSAPAPLGPHPDDRERPPVEPPLTPIDDLPLEEGEIVPEGEEDPGTEGAWAASGAGQESLLGEQGGHADPAGA